MADVVKLMVCDWVAQALSVYTIPSYLTVPAQVPAPASVDAHQVKLGVAVAYVPPPPSDGVVGPVVSTLNTLTALYQY